ncbi:MAG: sigma-54 dependent transcriptional regulator, partial [Desulfobacterales bacterium]|nr:sigma-54 dependent transcriptional regulator [Desulfobacterales bacterium]MDX2513087.1 sigma-54 dependent transcriptional regulator [Desulfobacterales bacterium]
GAVFDIALIDMTMPEMDGIELLEVIKNASPRTECIMVTAVNEARVAVECLKKGAYDYLLKPVSKEDLALSIHRALEHKRLLDLRDIGKQQVIPRLKNKDAFREINTVSKRMMRVLKEAELHAASNVPMLITGESGTGKELLARAIHRASPRRAHPFTAINMASLNGNLFDAEFFGHTRGAYTGAEKDRAGYLEYTDKGTLFLDEIGLLPMEVQGKLLRFMQDGRYLKLGTSADTHADVRFVAATNTDLEARMKQHLFRKDLYYRIRGGWLHLPPLRERKKDIPLLIRTFLSAHYDLEKGNFITPEALDILINYDFPGNVRELKAMVQSAINLAQGKPISPRYLPESIRHQKRLKPMKLPPGTTSLAPLETIEKNHILHVYRQLGKNKSQTARVLGIGLNTLRRKLAIYGEKGHQTTNCFSV